LLHPSRLRISVSCSASWLQIGQFVYSYLVCFLVKSLHHSSYLNSCSPTASGLIPKPLYLPYSPVNSLHPLHSFVLPSFRTVIMDDPINFITAEEYYQRAQGWAGPTRVTSLSQTPPATAPLPEFWHGVTLTFDDNTLCVVQFVRPTLFRVRYDPAVRDPGDYDDANR